MPTLTLQPDETSAVDTYINENAATTNYATDATLVVGNGAFLTTETTKALVKFDLSSIPVEAKVTSATLSIWVSSTPGSENLALRVQRLKRDWVEAEATWNIYSTGNDWQTAGANGANDIDTSVFIGTATILTTAVDGDQIDVTLTASEIEKLIDGTNTNYGLILRSNNLDNDDKVIFHSSSYATTTQRPKLVVNYELSSGFINFF